MKAVIISFFVLLILAVCVAVFGWIMVKWYSDALREAEGEFDPVQWEQRESLDGKVYWMPKGDKKIQSTVNK